MPIYIKTITIGKINKKIVWNHIRPNIYLMIQSLLYFKITKLIKIKILINSKLYFLNNQIYIEFIYNPLYHSHIITILSLRMKKQHDPQRLGYMHQSSLTFTPKGVTNYYKLLETYDPELLQKIQSHNSGFLGQNVYLLSVQLQPENIKWILWKNSQEIIQFIAIFETQINRMLSTSARAGKTGLPVMKKYQELLSQNQVSFNEASMKMFAEFLNLVALQPFLYKSEEFLLFIEHCISVDKWGTKIFQQVAVDKAPTIKNKIIKTVTKPCSGDPKNRTSADRGSLDRDYFITVTSDGILKSQNHLMESVIQSMIPFTNQFQKSSKISQAPQSYLSFSVNACYHENIDINFYKDYTKGVNFAIGLSMALKQSGYVGIKNRFQSFAPIRQNCVCKLYNDGIGYYNDLYNELMKAKKQVCITGWMITPYFLLKRPGKITDTQYRLDNVLQRLAQRGIKIFIIVFKQPKLFVNNDSEHVEYYLQSLHRNITVMRHPDNLIPLLWSHHEKMVIIDQKIGFMGGLDICYGRMDNHQHMLTDPGDIWDGCEYNNYRTKDIYEPRNYKQSNLNPSFQPRMPWHDIALQYRGDVVLDLLRHFVQYWYFVKWDEQFTMKQIIGAISNKFTPSNSTQQIQRDSYKNYMDFNKKDIKDKMKQKKKQLQQKHKAQQQQRTDQTMPQLFIQTKTGRIQGAQTLQMCRSASTWSIGVPNDKHQSSIHNAYQQLIQKSEKFIYIQNQFFMGLENKIVECIANRILKAFRQNKVFKVVIVLPLLPGFEGDISDPASSVLRIQVHHQYNSIIRGQNSLYNRLAQIPNIDDYVYFYGLRKAGVIGAVPVTEIIYVHSKLMIVDDKRAIIGSANINDRSLLGSRDSQLACIIEQNNGNIFDLRARIFEQHFGLSREQSYNHMHPKVWLRMIQNSKRNTEIYRRIFGCIPDDNITIVGEIKKLASQARITLYDELKNQIIGHAVDYPLNFLKDQDLTFRANQKQFYSPVETFT